MHLGKKIRKARINKDITQDQLANKIGRTRALISHIEQTGKVNHYTLAAIAKSLSLTIDDIEFIDEKQTVTTKKQILENDTLRNEIGNLKKENALLKEFVESQKKLIATLEKNSGKKNR